jgi:hypothetical protein
MMERDVPRETHRLERGAFLDKAEVVEPGVPAFLHPLAEERRDRLALAQWLADPHSPTTARAIVNRVWQAYFGVGLVETAEDFGSQGTPPSHPELLDWLAVELMEHDWSFKHLHRLILHSATYRQASTIRPELAERDPANRLLARGARFRVDAELVRDVALTASGLLNPEIGGPSVYPPAPEFLFEQPASFEPKTWFFDDGPEQYRRGLYTFRYRSVLHPALESFDAPTGSVSCVRRNRSNSPLQSLTMLNEALFMNCARALAARCLDEGGASDAERIAFAYRCCVSRLPTPEELAVLEPFLAAQAVCRRRTQRGGVAARYDRNPVARTNRTRRLDHAGPGGAQSRRNHHARVIGYELSGSPVPKLSAATACPPLVPEGMRLGAGGDGPLAMGGAGIGPGCHEPARTARTAF